MNSVERVKNICKARKIPISRLERDLEFGNGYINQLKKGMFPADRLAKIARYLDLSEEFLLTGQEKEKAPTQEDERNDEVAALLEFYRSRPDDCRMLFSVAKTATAEDIRAAAALIEALRKKEGR